jgi:ATP-dependent RNA helicase DeaD
LASFLPIVSQLAEEYDIHTIAAAALQMAYDHTVPAWQRSESNDQGAVGSIPAPQKRKARGSKNAPVKSSSPPVKD